jgi:hypothetical protein
MKYIIALLCAFILISCEYWDDRLKVENISSDTLYVAVGDTDAIESSLEINYAIKETKDGFTRKVSPGDTLIIKHYGKDFWDSFIEHADNKKLRIFTITQHDFNNNSWEPIGEGKLYRKIGSYGISDMEKHNWNIKVE